MCHEPVRVLCLVLAAGSELSAGEEIALSDVLGNWRQRQRDVVSLNMSWIERRTDVRGGLTPTFRIIRRSLDEELVFPPTDTSYENHYLVITSGSRSRVESRGWMWDFQHEELVPRNIVCVFDGEDARTLVSELGEAGSQKGIVNAGASHIQLNAYEFRALLWCFWPLDPVRGGLDPADVEMTSEELHIDGRRCALLKHGSHPAAEELWIDPDYGYAVRRAIVRNPDGTIHFQFDVDYGDDISNGLRVSGWSFQEIANDAVAVHCQSTVTELIINPAPDPGTFELAFPAGSLVNDVRSGTNNFSRVGPDGSLQPLGSRPPRSTDSMGRPSGLSNVMKAVIAANAAALLVALLIVRSRLRARRGRPSD